MEYTCIYDLGKQKQKWPGTLRLLHTNGQSYEVEITGRGTFFHVISGHHSYGNYICIPNHNVGCELADYSDVFWNWEQLAKHLRRVDAVTVACALTHLREL